MDAECYSADHLSQPFSLSSMPVELATAQMSSAHNATVRVDTSKYEISCKRPGVCVRYFRQDAVSSISVKCVHIQG